MWYLLIAGLKKSCSVFSVMQKRKKNTHTAHTECTEFIRNAQSVIKYLKEYVACFLLVRRINSMWNSVLSQQKWDFRDLTSTRKTGEENLSKQHCHMVVDCSKN